MNDNDRALLTYAVGFAIGGLRQLEDSGIAVSTRDRIREMCEELERVREIVFASTPRPLSISPLAPCTKCATRFIDPELRTLSGATPYCTECYQKAGYG